MNTHFVDFIIMGVTVGCLVVLFTHLIQ